MLFDKESERRTSVVVHAVAALGLEHGRAVGSVPPGLTQALPHALLVGVARASVPAVPRASREGTMASIPARHAHARPILALAVFAAPVCRFEGTGRGLRNTAGLAKGKGRKKNIQS